MSSPPSFFLHNSSPSAFYTLSLHDALPISFPVPVALFAAPILSENAARMIASIAVLPDVRVGVISQAPLEDRSEEHTSELQSHSDLVCRLLLEKKKRSSATVMRRSMNSYIF